MEIKCTVDQDSTPTFIARVACDLLNLTQATCQSVSYAIYDRQGGNPSVPIASGNLTVNSVIFNTLQTGDPRWKTDTVGYNFLYSGDVAWFVATGPDRYHAVFKFTSTSGKVAIAKFTVTVKQTRQ